MSTVTRGHWRGPLVLVLTMALPLSAMADEQYDLLKRQVEALQSQLAEVQAALQEYASDNASKEEVAQLRQEVAEAKEWKEPNSLIHMAGYADVGYANQENADGSFNVGTFAPIFHYQYRDIVMLESELEI